MTHVYLVWAEDATPGGTVGIVRAVRAVCATRQAAEASANAAQLREAHRVPRLVYTVEERLLEPDAPA